MSEEKNPAPLCKNCVWIKEGLIFDTCINEYVMHRSDPVRGRPVKCRTARKINWYCGDVGKRFRAKSL